MHIVRGFPAGRPTPTAVPRLAKALAGLALVAMSASVVNAQQQPAGTPAAATQPATTRAAAPANPRDKLPFTNTDVTKTTATMPTLFIAGDSTAANGSAAMRGWAALLVDYFDTSKVNLVNRGIGGARFNTYLAAARPGGQSPWDQILAAVKPGDFVVIEFGHNSGPLAGIGEETQEVAGRAGAAPTAMHTHGWYLRKMIDDVRAKKATPIASTLTLRNKWADGKIERLKEQTAGQGGMSDWTRQVAAAEHVLLVDHSNIIGDRFDVIGQAEADNLFGDHYLHTNTAGAIINCEAFIAGLKALPNMPLVDDLNDKGKAIPAYKAPPSTAPAR